MDIGFFSTSKLNLSIRKFFTEILHIPLNQGVDLPYLPESILKNNFNPSSPVHALLDEVYFSGMIDELSLDSKKSDSSIDKIRDGKKDYLGLLIFGVLLKKRKNGLLPTRSQMAEITRLFNREFCYTPVVVIFKYDDLISIANCERTPYKIQKEGEKVGKVTMLKDIRITNPHAAHLKILAGLSIDNQTINSFEKLYRFWQNQFSLQALNDQFYKDLQDWFYYALQNIKLPFKPDFITDKENVKNFLVRLLARTMFCWFIKEKGLIKPELLELTDWEGNKYPLTNDINEKTFLDRNSYYRGILQNMFFNALNKREKKSIKDFKWTKYLLPGFNFNWFIEIPYLSGGIFDKLQEDNANESIEDTVIKIPNFLFYGIETEESVKKGKGARATTFFEKVEHKGLNGILKSYKFTLDENTPFEEDIALDPEMLGLVFENLLAELDPNLEESTISSIRKLTGSYYTPRRTINEMVNDSLYLYLTRFFNENYPKITNAKKHLNDLVYFNLADKVDSHFREAVVHGLDQFKMLDPACGSGAFPMGMLHKMVDILKIVDANNDLWLSLKLKNVDSAQKSDFKKILTVNLDNYSRKIGIIRDSIYGIDIQPMAVQITKLRFFISLLIDQKTDAEITPLPNIETKIICADSLKNIDPDLFSADAIEKLTDARTRYYRSENSLGERELIADEIADILDIAFPSFAYQITGKRISGQNRILIKEWFTHSTLAAPFFNLDFFFPELKQTGGFDCVIGNPPYGGFKISDSIKETLILESKDPYGAFIARFLNNADKRTPLKKGGVLAYIVSDTFMTIKSHLPLRKMLMQNYIHKMLRMHKNTFMATVNTVIMIVERNEFRRDENGKSIVEFNDKHICLMADMTNISIHDDYERFSEVLNQVNDVEFDNKTQSISNEEYAIYCYPQYIIKSNSNMPFFVASPKLFSLMNDGNDPLNKLPTKLKVIGAKKVPVRILSLDSKEVELVKFGDIAEVKQGLATGDNGAYLFQNPEAWGTYRSIDDFKTRILTEKDLMKIRSNNSLRLEVIEKGISKSNTTSKRYFEGRYIIPYDKGGESDAEGGWMPNYSVTTNYYIDWSEWSVNRMKTLTTIERNRLYGKIGGNTKLCSRFQNSESYFKKAIDCSRVGEYSPTYRLASDTVYDSGCNDIYVTINTREHNLGILASKFWRFQFINFINHTVNSQTDDNDELMYVLIKENINLESEVNRIITNQQMNPHYDYSSNEQLIIDKLVYLSYGLNDEDVKDVENWYVRRYLTLSTAQKANLRALGKSDDYLVLYGLKEEIR